MTTKSKLDYTPSHKMDGKYAVIQEFNANGESESWLYFIRVEGNEENLKHLQEQLESIEWYVLDDLSCIDIDMDNFMEF